jgi:hypothetical protein
LQEQNEKKIQIEKGNRNRNRNTETETETETRPTNSSKKISSHTRTSRHSSPVRNDQIDRPLLVAARLQKRALQNVGVESHAPNCAQLLLLRREISTKIEAAANTTRKQKFKHDARRLKSRAVIFEAAINLRWCSFAWILR